MKLIRVVDFVHDVDELLRAPGAADVSRLEAMQAVLQGRTFDELAALRQGAIDLQQLVETAMLERGSQ